jgi:hypothetical protein
VNRSETAPRIVRFEINNMPRPKPAGFSDRMPTVTATFDDGSREDLFSFYPDEIMFGEGELIGLTEQEAHDLRQRKDAAFLRRFESLTAGETSASRGKTREAG